MLHFYPKPGNYTLNVTYSTFNYLYPFLGDNLSRTVVGPTGIVSGQD